MLDLQGYTYQETIFQGTRIVARCVLSRTLRVDFQRFVPCSRRDIHPEPEDPAGGSVCAGELDFTIPAWDKLTRTARGGTADLLDVVTLRVHLLVAAHGHGLRAGVGWKRVAAKGYVRGHDHGSRTSWRNAMQSEADPAALLA